MSDEAEQPVSPGAVARQLARALDQRKTEYALGGAIALGFWAQPRGTMDVDLTLFMSNDKPSEVIWELQEIGCDVSATSATRSIRDHGFCRATFATWRVDVFVPTIPFYEQVKARRKRVFLGDQQVTVLDAESLAVFKIMFFRRQDIVDIGEILRIQGPAFDRIWVRDELAKIVGARDPRVIQWDELVSEIQP